MVADQLTRYGRRVRRAVPPTPIIVVVVLFAMIALAGLAIGIGGLIFGGGGAIGFSLIALLMTAVFAVTAQSLWQARRGAWLTAIILGVVLIVLGLPLVGRRDLGGLGVVLSGAAVIALVAVPQTARDWFSPTRHKP
jgi:lysylphosphatidylglycerol synthetase-like protein (DUF2156 family)